jgi:two-component system chemotaxis response regulator CheY
MPEVLIVEDATFMRNLYRELLADTPVTIVEEATNGVEGVDFYKEHTPDVVVMNIRMPILDGIEATEQIIEYDPDATVVMCTGNRQQAKMKEAVEAGASDYITKPFQRGQFISAVRDATE